MKKVPDGIVKILINESVSSLHKAQMNTEMSIEIERKANPLKLCTSLSLKIRHLLKGFLIDSNTRIFVSNSNSCCAKELHDLFFTKIHEPCIIWKW